MDWIAGLVVGLLLGGGGSWLVQVFRARSRLDKQASDHQRTIAKLNLDYSQTVAGLRGQLDEVRSTERLLEDAKKALDDRFKATASRALEANNQQFMNLAKAKLGETLENAKGEFKVRHEQFQALVKPLAENYGKLNPNIESLVKQGHQLAAETGKLSSALTNNRRIGDWGEMQLRRVVELAGMTKYCDFTEQRRVSDSRKKPDLIVRLPQGRKVVVDSKASIEAYLEAEGAEDGSERDKALRRHAGALRSQVNDLAGKDYGTEVEGSLDFVVMFVPGDQFLAAALEAENRNGKKDANLIAYAMSKRVAIATPSSLIALLWTVANGWTQQRLSENAERIRKAGEEMHKRMEVFIGHYEKVGRGLKSTLDAFNASVGSYDNRILPQGRKFSELVTGDEDNSLRPPGTIEKPVRVSRYAKELPPVGDQSF